MFKNIIMISRNCFSDNKMSNLPFKLINPLNKIINKKQKTKNIFHARSNLSGDQLHYDIISPKKMSC